jgi:hypothetical protein
MNQAAIPVPLINPKVSGVGVVIKKDGTISKPEPKPKELDHGRNPGSRSA